MVPLNLLLDAIEIWVGENRHLKYTPKIQNRAVIIIFGSRRKQSCKSCWKKFQILSLPRISNNIFCQENVYLVQQFNKTVKDCT